MKITYRFSKIYLYRLNNQWVEWNLNNFFWSYTAMQDTITAVAEEQVKQVIEKQEQLAGTCAPRLRSDEMSGFWVSISN